MAASSSSQRGERRGRWGSPERTVVWTEPKPKPKPARKVAVVYYLCHRDGHLDHPHFLEMELPRSSHPAAPGLHLRDFTARLNGLRGNGMAGMYSWSSKRSYRNGYVWQDLTEDDLIHPAHGNDEYVLKGSPLLLFPQPPPAHQDASSTFSQDRRAGRHRKNWSSFDLGDCNNKLLVAQQSAATQTDHGGPDRDADPSTELAIDEISPPPSSSSPDALESCSREVGVIAGGRMRASAVLMQIFSCGSMTAVKRGQARTRSDLATASAGTRLAEVVDAYASATAECLSVPGGAGVVERDYFSGSLIESSKKRGGDDALLLKRSSSCNADRGAAKLKLPVRAKEVRAGCLASRGSRAPKKNMTKSTAAQSRDGGECKGATADGPGGQVARYSAEARRFAGGGMGTTRCRARAGAPKCGWTPFKKKCY